MKNKVAVYFRCSTDKQDNSIADQRAVLVKYATRNGLSITTWFDKDEGKSGTSFEKRPDFMRMVRLVESGRHDFSQILVYDIDRWGRPTDPSESIYWEIHLKKRGVVVRYILDESVNENSMVGRISKAFKQELASEESRKQSVRVTERSKLRVAEGFRVGGFAPYGYKRLLVQPDGTPIRVLEHGERKAEKSQRVILTPGDADEVRIIQRIFYLRASGRGARYISNLLNGENIPSPTASRPHTQNEPGKWSLSTVSSILKNPIYIGRYTYNKQIRGSWSKLEEPKRTSRAESEWIVCENSHEGIVTPELFERAQLHIRKNNGKRAFGRGIGSTYLLTGKITCKECGYNFHGHKKNNGYGKSYRYYEDSGYRLRGDSVCQRTSVPADSLEKYLLSSLDSQLPLMINPDKLKRLIAQKLSDRADYQPNRKRELKSQSKAIDIKLENLTTALEAGGDFDSVLKRMSSRKDEQTRIETEAFKISDNKKSHIDIEQSVKEISRLAEGAMSRLNSKQPDVVKGAIGNFLDRVEIDGKNRTATFFIYKIPNVSRTYGDFVSVKTCRRSDFDKTDNRIGPCNL